MPSLNLPSKALFGKILCRRLVIKNKFTNFPKQMCFIMAKISALQLLL